jgi:kynureninase
MVYDEGGFVGGNNFEPGRDYAKALDDQDPLTKFRDEFLITDPDLIYLDGNSLGRLPKRSISHIQTLVEDEWGGNLIRGWDSGWYDAANRIGDKIAGLVGASKGSTIVSDSTSVNLYKLVQAAIKARSGRTKIISDELNFPSDLYVLDGAARFANPGINLEIVPSLDDIEINQEKLFDAIDEETIMVSFSHVSFKSGYLYRLQEIVDQAHRVGALVLVDLSHSVGAVPIELDEWKVDLAIGCTYKYLNGGPGSPAFLYIRDEIRQEMVSPIWGWFGQTNPFEFSLEYQPVESINRFMVGTPPILSLSAIEPAIDIILEAGIERIRHKSVLQSTYLIDLFDHYLAPKGFKLGSPRDASRRGSHVSIQHDLGYQISQAMIEEKSVLPDFREPDNIRLGLAPLYVSFEDVWQATTRIRQLVADGLHLKYPQARKRVT